MYLQPQICLWGGVGIDPCRTSPACLLRVKDRRSTGLWISAATVQVVTALAACVELQCGRHSQHSRAVALQATNRAAARRSVISPAKPVDLVGTRR